MNNIFDIILLLALPASGKSETRKFIASFDDKLKKDVFHLGKNAQIDDFPYVHLMRTIDVELKKLGENYVFFHAPDKTFIDQKSWGVLTLLLSEDYERLVKTGLGTGESIVDLMKRIDNARKKLDAKPIFYDGNNPVIPEKHILSVQKALQKEYDCMQQDRLKDVPSNLEGSTLIIEFARGGADGSTMPLPYGYEYNLKLLSPELLKKAAILYVWVTPEESRRKNFEREDPNDPGSILAHCVPIEVMMNEYGCDDIEYLIKSSEKPGFIKIDRNDGKYYIPIERFDNRNDKTSFVREEIWKDDDKKVLFENLKENFSKLFEKFKSLNLV